MPIVGALPFPLTDGTTALGSQALADITKVKDDVNSNAAAAGANSNITSLTGLTTALDYTLGGSNIWIATAVSGGSANAQTVTTVYPITGWSLAEGKRVNFEAGNTNTSATTLAVNGGTAKNVYKLVGTAVGALTGGELVSGQRYDCIYDGTQFIVVNPTDWGAGRCSFSAHKNGTNQTGVADSTDTKVTFGTAIFNVGSLLATSTWTPPRGRIQILSNVYMSAGLTNNSALEIKVYKNGSSFKTALTYTGAVGDGAVNISMIDLAVGTDTYDIYINAVSATTSTVSGTISRTYFMGTMI